MKNKIIINIISSAILVIPASLVYASPPKAPDINISSVGKQIIVNFDPIAGAEGYRLYYAEFPSLNRLHSIDLRNKTQFKTILDDAHYFVSAVKSYNSDGESGYSNIEFASLNEDLLGGETTLFDESSHAFSSPAPNLDTKSLDVHLAGDEEFEQTFVTSPATINPGLGPLFNNTSCEACHPKDGRGAPPEEGGKLDTMFLRISIPGTRADSCGAPKPVPGFGTQLFQKATFGVQPQADVTVHYKEETRHFADGEAYSLRTPSYDVKPYTPFPADIMFSPRVAPTVFGRGLLDAIPEATLLALADEQDIDGDGISGKANYVCDPITKKRVIGRMGLKANNADTFAQNAGAFHNDIGITSPVHPVDTSANFPQADGKADDPEITQQRLDDVTFYVQTLAVPARRNIGKDAVKQGQLIFGLAGCGSCHVPTLKTGELKESNPEKKIIESVSNQTIHPYTDMLLHDMGDGLADNRPDHLADGKEWRTPPLWGIGLTKTIHNHTFFLHDGRARNLMEAIMWHDGEAVKSKDYVNQLNKEQRHFLIDFLNSL
ncbi:MAG: thiol oxidoreductase [Methylococcales bacterium]|nr:thiol oxidoreductase [Methylococcales bacterium]